MIALTIFSIAWMSSIVILGWLIGTVHMMQWLDKRYGPGPAHIALFLCAAAFFLLIGVAFIQVEM